MTGVQLFHLHPEVAHRDCDHCRKWQYNHETGELELWRGQPIAREGPPPCHYGPDRCAKGSPDDSKALTPQNLQAYRHYMECKATFSFPDDAIVRRNAGVIKMAEEIVSRLALVKTILGVRKS